MEKIFVFGILEDCKSCIKNKYCNQALQAEREYCPCAVYGVATDWLNVRDFKLYPNIIVEHYSSSELQFMNDMGITSNLKHDIYDKGHPDGYELVYLGCFRCLDEESFNRSVAIVADALVESGQCDSLLD